MGTKITVIGAGSVGAAITNDIMVQGMASEILLIDINKQKAFGEALDIYQGAPFCSPAIVRSGDYEDAVDSDIVIITEDDSRDEPLDKIMQGFVDGAVKAGKTLDKDLFTEPDRKKAIKLALDKAKKGDLVLILGKGHEKTILRADGPHEFEDTKVARALLRAKK